MDEAAPRRPLWLPDTQGFLAIAIILLIACIVLMLLMKPITIDERTAGVLMVVIGVLTGCLKDVYSFFFGSSKGSSEKTEALAKAAVAAPQPLPPAPVSTVTTTTDDRTVTRTEPVAATPLPEPKL